MAYATRRSYAGAAPACTLTNAITSSDTTATLTGDVSNWNNTANGGFYMVIDPGLSTEEKVLVGSRSSTALSSITRGVDGTTASAHAAGATCYPVFTAIDADQANKVASTLTTKGDLLATDGSALNRLAVGTNDYVLKADSSATNGVAWGQIAAAGIASDAVTTAKILDSNVTAAKLAADSVTTAKILDANVTTAKIADANVTGAKLANLTVSTKTGSYTLVAADRNTRVVMNSASSTTITVNSSLFSAGDVVWIHNIGAGVCTVTAGTATVTTSGSLALAQWGGGTLYFTSASAAIFFPAGGAVGYGAGSGGTSSSITDGGIAYTLHTFTSDGTFTVTREGIFELFLCGGGGGAGTNFIGRTYGDSGGTGAAVTICKMVLPVGSYTVDVGAPSANSIFAPNTDYQVIGLRGNAGGSTGEYSYGPDTDPPLTKLTVPSSWPSTGRDADTYIAPVGRVGISTAAKAYDVVLYNGKKSVSTTGGSALDGVSLTFSGAAYNYGSGGSYSNGQQGTGAGARSVASSKYGAGGGGGDSNGGATSGFQGIVMIRYR